MKIKKIILLGLACLLWSKVQAQNVTQKVSFLGDTALPKKTSWVILNAITLVGNKQTKPHIVYRELSFKTGDTLLIEKVDSLLERTRNNIFNTNLFVSVRLSLIYQAPQYALLNIYLEERWYLFPGPIFELSDRNFNEWLRTYNADLSRTNYGMRLVLENLRGRGEKLDTYLQFGFTKKFGFSYQIPYINRKQVLGLSINTFYAQNKSIAFKTDEHVLKFYESEKIASERYLFNLTLNRRIGIFDYHGFGAGFQSHTVEDSLINLNPRFFRDGRNRQRFFFLNYRYTRDTRDTRNYPLHGDILEIALTQNGLGIFDDLLQTQLGLRYIFFTDLKHRFYAANSLRAFASIQQNQPYTQARGLGYQQDVMRGFELYVIDGQAFLLNQNTLRYQLFSTQKKMNFVPIKQFQTIPLAMYANLFLDAGYVRDTNFRDFSSRFSNKFIYSWGAGIDLVSFYDLILRCNYSINSDGEKGLFFRINSAF